MDGQGSLPEGWRGPATHHLSLHRCEVSQLLHEAIRERSTQVLRGHLRRNCDECGGALTSTQTPAAIQDTLTIFRNVASYHGFQLLQDSTEWLLQAHSAFS